MFRIKNFLRQLPILFALLALAPSPWSASVDHWAVRAPLSQVNNLAGIAYGNGIFVAVGSAGAEITSSDEGYSWGPQTNSISGDCHAITFGAGKFVVVTALGTIHTSTDGIQWTKQESGTSAPLFGVTYTGNIFVAVGDAGTVLTSSDGNTWTSRFGNTSVTLYAVTYGNGTFAAVGSNNTIIASSDGVTWQQQIVPGAIEIRGIAYGNNTFVAGGIGGIVISKNGVDWVEPSPGTSGDIEAVYYSNGVFVTVGGGGSRMISVDGRVWGGISIATSLRLKGIVSGNGIFAAVGAEGVVVTSADAKLWIERYSFRVNRNTLGSVAYLNGMFVAVGDEGAVVASTNGETWVHQPFAGYKISPGSSSGGGTNFVGIAYGNGTYTAIANAGWFAASASLSSLVLRKTGITNRLSGIAYGKGLFVAVGDRLIATSPDGTNWTVNPALEILNPGLGVKLNAITFERDLFVAVGSTPSFSVFRGPTGAIFTSEDGMNWSDHSSDAFYGLQAVTYGNNRFVSVGNGSVAISADGTNWKWAALPGRVLGSIAYGNGLFVAVEGVRGSFTTSTVDYSTDGVNWTRQEVPAGLNGIAFGNGTFVGIGGAAIVQSDVLPLVGPAINFSLGPQLLTLSWPTNFLLQARATFDGADAWSSISVPTAGAEQFTLKVDPVGPSRFFRLVQP